MRNILVAPFGLKTSGATAAPRDMIGIFPVISQTPDRLVAGFNDSHLDFRVVVDVAAQGAGQHVTATTLVKTHNWLGRTYLAIILPFHRLVVRTMLRAGRSGLKAARASHPPRSAGRPCVYACHHRGDVSGFRIIAA